MRSNLTRLAASNSELTKLFGNYHSLQLIPQKKSIGVPQSWVNRPTTEPLSLKGDAADPAIHEESSSSDEIYGTFEKLIEE